MGWLQVIKGSLYLGSRAQAQNWQLLQSLSVTHIVNVSREITEPFKGAGPVLHRARLASSRSGAAPARQATAHPADACPLRRCLVLEANAWLPSPSLAPPRFLAPCAGKIEYHQCGVPDTEKADILGAGASSFKFIEDALASNASACVLVHCASGVSRSVALVVHYMMRKRGLSCSKAMECIRAVHPAAQPNQGFLRQLEELELRLTNRDASPPCGERTASAFDRVCSWARVPSIEDVGWMTRASFPVPASTKGGYWSRTPSAAPLSAPVREASATTVTLVTPLKQVAKASGADDDSRSVGDDDAKSVASAASTAVVSDSPVLSEASECEDSSNNSSPRVCHSKPLSPAGDRGGAHYLFWRGVSADSTH